MYIHVFTDNFKYFHTDVDFSSLSLPLLDAEDGQGQAWLHDRGEVLSRRNYPDGRVLMKVRLTTDKAGQAQAKFGRAMKLLGQKKAAAE